jgi:hypothetical protein
LALPIIYYRIFFHNLQEKAGAWVKKLQKSRPKPANLPQTDARRGRMWYTGSILEIYKRRGGMENCVRRAHGREYIRYWKF